jgi:outer membrane protein OmpU
MKKILLATTMLAATAGLASAEITMNGSARMGMTYSEGTAGTAAIAGTRDTFSAGTRTVVAGAVTADNIAAARAAVFAAEAALGAASTEAARTAAAAALADRQAELAARLGTAAVAATDATTRMEYRTRVNFTGSGETDSGLSYSATVRIQDSSTVGTTNAIGVTVSGAFGSLTFGSESSAAEYAVGDLAGVGYGAGPGGADTTFISGAFALYSYTADNFTVYVSSGQVDSDAMSIGGKFSAGALTVGLGYEDDGADTHTAASVSYAMGDTTLKAIYGRSSDLDYTQSGISIAHTMGTTSLSAYYRTDDTAGAETTNYGVGAAMDLGGGGAVKGGFQSINDRTYADLGLTFSF